MTTAVPLIPREIIFGNPDQSDPQISPDGTRVAYLAPHNNVLNVWVQTIGQDDGRVVTADTYRGIQMFLWSSDSQHILYPQDVGGDENYRLYASDLDGAHTRDLTPFENVRSQIIHSSKYFPDQLLIGLNKDDPAFHDVYHLRVSSGELTLIAKNPGNVSQWVPDANFTVRGKLTADEVGGTALHVRDSADGEWRIVAEWSVDDSLTSGPVGFSRAGNVIYLRDARNVNAARLVALDLASGQITEIVADPNYDVDWVITHPDTYEPQLVSIMKDRVEWHVLDASVEADLAAIRAIRRGDCFITGRDDADQTWIVTYTADDAPWCWYAYHRPTQKATFLFYRERALSQYPLAQTEPFEFTARDGLTVHGYIAFPPGQRAGPLPMVLNVHGGPWGRNLWLFDHEMQFFTNRGYVCMQVNFRGSTGYGKAFLNAGDREWGGAMHNDLIDAANWAIQQGYADPKRIAIFGWSYGGYAALAGATFTPDFFRCAISAVGPSHLATLLQTIPPYWATLKYTMFKRVGDPDKDKDFLDSRSPLYKADRIKIPMLIAQGANDPRVKREQSEKIVEVMKKNGVPYRYLLFEDEGHGFARPENRLKFFAEVEAFLAEILGGRHEGG